MLESLTWLEYGVDQAGHLLRVEQAICTPGVCNTLLIPVAVEYQTAKFLVAGRGLVVVWRLAYLLPAFKL